MLGVKQGKLLIIMGLAGSGKSYLINSLAYDYLKEENFANGDDEEIKNIKELISALNSGKFCIVSERKYHSENNRKKFLEEITKKTSSELPIQFICFENDLDAANNNCKKRKNKPNDIGGEGHIKQNNNDTKNYEIPDNAIVCKIHCI